MLACHTGLISRPQMKHVQKHTSQLQLCCRPVLWPLRALAGQQMLPGGGRMHPGCCRLLLLLLLLLLLHMPV